MVLLASLAGAICGLYRLWLAVLTGKLEEQVDKDGAIAMCLGFVIVLSLITFIIGQGLLKKIAGAREKYHQYLKRTQQIEDSRA